MANHTDKELLLMIWQSLEDMREYNSNRVLDAEMWHKDKENDNKRSSQFAVTDCRRELAKSNLCIKYIEKKLKELK